MGPYPVGFLNYFKIRFPYLLLHVFRFVLNSKCKNEPVFQKYLIGNNGDDSRFAEEWARVPVASYPGTVETVQGSVAESNEAAASPSIPPHRSSSQVRTVHSVLKSYL